MTDNIKHPPYDELLAFLPQLERLGPDDVYLPDRPDEEPEIDDQGIPIYFFQGAEYSPVVRSGIAVRALRRLAALQAGGS